MSGSSEHDPTSRIVEEVDDANVILQRLRSQPAPADLLYLLTQRLRAEGARRRGGRRGRVSSAGHRSLDSANDGARFGCRRSSLELPRPAADRSAVSIGLTPRRPVQSRSRLVGTTMIRTTRERLRRCASVLLASVGGAQAAG